VWAPTFFGLGACYAVGFFAVAADWFWGRWFGLGLGNSGVSLVVWVVIMTRELPGALLWFGLVHAVVVACLAGDRMAAVYEGREDWRKRFHIDDQGVLRLRRSVTRAATSLPSLIVLALKPKEDPASMALAAVALVAAGGLVGVLRGRAWGVLAVGAAGVAAIASGLVSVGGFDLSFIDGVTLPSSQIALFAGALLVAAFAPFARPVRTFLIARR
jgi:hypothetical protein